MSKDTSGPAFPGEQGTAPDGTWNQTWSPGMTLRQYYAGQAMKGVVSDGEHVDWKIMMRDLDRDGGFEDCTPAVWAEWVAQRAYMIADAMLAHEAREAANGN